MSLYPALVVQDLYGRVTLDMFCLAMQEDANALHVDGDPNTDDEDASASARASARAWMGSFLATRKAPVMVSDAR